MRLGIAALALSLGATSASLAQQPARPPSLETRAERALWWGDFADLERLHTELRRTNPRSANGTTQWVDFRDGLDKVLDGDRRLHEAYYTEMGRLTLGWAEQNPGSPLAHVLHAKALVAHAWALRGTGMANTVPPQAWADFERYMARAAEYLMQHSRVAFTISDAHAAMLGISRVAGWSTDRQWALLRDGLARNPDDDSLYFTMLNGVLPKWGGTPAGVDRFINEATALTREKQGTAMYARLYAAAA
jgi:hypothetical protein